MTDARLLLAIRLWHRFADSSIESFDDETHKAEYGSHPDTISEAVSQVAA